MIHQNEKRTEWVSDIYEDYANCSWTVGQSSVCIVGASGHEVTNIDWDDVPALVSDLMLLYEKAREYMLGRNAAERKVPNLK